MRFEPFVSRLTANNLIANLRAGLIGEGREFTTPFGIQKLVYADYTASGRALLQIEDFVAQEVLPFYANSHTESSCCGEGTTQMREEARSIIAAKTNAGDSCTVIFSGSGATAAVNRLVALCGIAELHDAAQKPVVFICPYEHHSNILPWRESGADVIEIDEAFQGGPDLEMLERELLAHADRPLLIGAFTAASNVSGIITDVDAVTRVLKKFGALSFWDYAGGGPYLPIDMNPGAELEKDAIFLSPHKFIGGPGASGLLIVRNSVVKATRPTWPGGGSVSYVSPWDHDYLDSLTEREEAGTPNIIGDIRAALVFLVKAAIGTDFIAERDAQLCQMAMNSWGSNPRLRLFGTDKPNRLPIFSFAVRDGVGGYVHHQLFTRMLSDICGIQTRAGCVCAGPYGHRLLDVGRDESERIRLAINAGKEVLKPGWVRLNLSYVMDDATARKIIDGVNKLSRNAHEFAHLYTCNEATAVFATKSNPKELLESI